MPNNLEQILINKIDKAGGIDLGEFISTALIHPEHGYYSNRDPLGAAGDFTTAPEISQMFGEVVGAWVIDLWMRMGSPKALNLIECGAGRGTLLADIMRVSSCVGGFVEAVQIHIIEASPLLRKKQRQALDGYDVKWHENISDVSVDNSCIILGNEFLDALPIEQVKRGEDGWQQRIITIDSGAFKYGWRKADKALLEMLPTKTESNQIYEVSPARNGFIDDCAKLLNKNGGAALFIDYGYIRLHYCDTLQSMKSHEFVDVLQDIGACDITSHIDFDALSKHASNQGVSVEQIITQRKFLLSLGIGARHSALKNVAESEAVAIDLDQGLKRLIATDQMGDLFKVMCFHSSINITPAGY